MAGNWFTDTFANPKFKQFASEGLQDLGYGLSTGTNFGNALGGATQRMQDLQPYRAQVAQQKAAEAKLAEQGNMTSAWVSQNYPQYANLPPDQAWQAAMAAEAAKQKAGAGGNATFFGTPIWGTTADGQAGFGQLNNQGQFQLTEMPEGFQVGKDPIKLDAGTHFVLLDPVTRQPVGQIPKDNEGAAFDTATGAGLGKTNAENITAYESMNSKMPGLRSVMGELGELAKTATYTQSGQLIDNAMREVGMAPSEAAIARTRYIAIVDNQVLPLLRDTFGAAFTVQEGESLRATLGDPNKSPAEKQAVLESFIAQKERDVAGMRSRIPGQGGQPQNYVFNPATGRLEAQ